MLGKVVIDVSNSSLPPWNQPSPLIQPPAPQKWYTKSAWIIGLLILFFPVGLYLMWRYSHWPRSIKWIITGILAFACLVDGIASAASPTSQPSQSAASQQATFQPTNLSPITQQPPTASSTPSQPVHYPPQTVNDLHHLADEGDASAVHTFHSESVGLTGTCPQPKREVTVDPGITGKQLTEDLLAYFYAEQLDSPCGSIVFAYHTQSEANDGYTAGRIDFEVSSADGQANVDPNASNLTYKLTLDLGSAFGNQQEYVVKY